MVAREGFVYEQKPLSVTRNVVVFEGWSLVRVVVRQGFYCMRQNSGPVTHYVFVALSFYRFIKVCVEFFFFNLRYTMFNVHKVTFRYIRILPNFTIQQFRTAAAGVRV